MDIIRAATSLAEDGQSDEIELDFDTLDSATLWKLEGYLRSLNPVGAGNGNFNVQVSSHGRWLAPCGRPEDAQPPFGPRHQCT